MADLLLVSNPRKRRRHKNTARRRRRVRHHRRSNPRSHRKYRRRNPQYRRHHYRRRSNPSFSGMSGRVMPIIKESYVGAGGALANDALYNIVSPMLSTFLGAAGASGGFVQYGVKMVTALGIGWLAKFVKMPGRDLAVGAGTVATHDFLKAQLMTNMPSLFGSGAPLALSGYSGFGAYLSGSAPIVGTATFPATNLPFNQPTQMGAYLSGSSGMSDGGGMYTDDAMGCDPWSGNY